VCVYLTVTNGESEQLSHGTTDFSKLLYVITKVFLVISIIVLYVFSKLCLYTFMFVCLSTIVYAIIKLNLALITLRAIPILFSCYIQTMNELYKFLFRKIKSL
jgi:hypothetical protein